MAAAEESTAVKNRNELIAGTNAGFVCKLVEYPLDTVKVQAQTQSAGGTPVSPIALLRKTMAEDGFFALYRGIPSPLLGSMVENSMLFSSYAFAGRMLSNDPEQMPFSQKLLCGAFSGVCVATVLTPVELIKCRMQTVNAGAVKYANSWQCLTSTIKAGGIKSLFYGHTGTLAREVPGNAAWFGGYELGCILMTPKGGSRKDIHPAGLAAAGAMGGMSYWGLPFPMDVVKSKIQTNTHNLPAGVKVSVPTVFNHVLKTEGVKGLYRGCGITVARAAPSNAVLFVVYELSMRLLRGQKLLGS